MDSDDDDSNRIYIGSLDEDMEIDFAEFGGVCEVVNQSFNHCTTLNNLINQIN